MKAAIVILFAVGWLGINAIRMKYYMNMMQIEGYKDWKYIGWVDSHKDVIYGLREKLHVVSMVALTAVFMLLGGYKSDAVYYAVSLCMLIVTYAVLVLNAVERREIKKPLVFTPRARRLFVMSLSVSILDAVIVLALIEWLSGDIVVFFPVWAGILAVVSLFSAYYMILANKLVKPVELSINKKFYDAAAQKIRSLNGVTTVGITGSYGKTSTKYAMATILSERFKVLKTPESYNTQMGVSRVINESLTDEYEIFIAEMGADKVGDIDEIALLANPKIGVITSIGPCHLETFKSIDNIMRTKYELIERLPNDGTAIFNYDNEFVRKLSDKTFKDKITYGIDNIEDTDIFATDIRVDSTGSTFTLCDNRLGTIECRTKLLGRHNILNILACAAVGRTLGMTLSEISAGISKLEGVEHRLQLIDPGTGVLVIDDAFNSNPDGARAALDVLNSFEGMRKIIVTPGMVELGDIEVEENEKFGRQIAAVCDVVILVGKKRTEPIFRGMIACKFNDKSIYVVNSLEESSKVLMSFIRANDVVLYENDLPDTYNEN